MAKLEQAVVEKLGHLAKDMEKKGVMAPISAEEQLEFKGFLVDKILKGKPKRKWRHIKGKRPPRSITRAKNKDLLAERRAISNFYTILLPATATKAQPAAALTHPFLAKKAPTVKWSKEEKILGRGAKTATETERVEKESAEKVRADAEREERKERDRASAAKAKIEEEEEAVAWERQKLEMKEETLERDQRITEHASLAAETMLAKNEQHLGSALELMRHSDRAHIRNILLVFGDDMMANAEFDEEVKDFVKQLKADLIKAVGGEKAMGGSRITIPPPWSITNDGTISNGQGDTSMIVRVVINSINSSPTTAPGDGGANPHEEQASDNNCAIGEFAQSMSCTDISDEIEKQLMDPDSALCNGEVTDSLDGWRSLVRTKARRWIQHTFSQPTWRTNLSGRTFSYRQDLKFTTHFRATLIGKRGSCVRQETQELSARASEIAEKAAMAAVAMDALANAVLAKLAASAAIGAAEAALEAMKQAEEDAEEVREECHWMSQFACQAAKLAAMVALKAVEAVHTKCNLEILPTAGGECLLVPQMAIEGVLKAQAQFRGLLARRELCTACQERGILLAMPGTIQNGPGWYLIPAGQPGFEFVTVSGSHCVELKTGANGEWEMGTPITCAAWSASIIQKKTELERPAEQHVLEAMEVPTEVLDYEALVKQDANMTNLLIAAFADDEPFLTMANSEGQAVVARDVAHDEKLAAGIKVAVDKGALKLLAAPCLHHKVDVVDKTAEEVAMEIIATAPRTFLHWSHIGCVVVLSGATGTGKRTTVARMKERMPEATLEWTNDGIFRALAMLASLHCQRLHPDGITLSDTVLINSPVHTFSESRVTTENVKTWMDMLTFGKFNGEYDIQIKGYGLDTFMSKVKDHVLKGPLVTTALPAIFKHLQGEVVAFSSNAIRTMCRGGYNVILEGKSAHTVDYDEQLITNRR
jgi:hypothetical protein